MKLFMAPDPVRSGKISLKLQFGAQLKKKEKRNQYPALRP